MIFVVTGPSGCGKSTLVRRVLQDLEGIRFSVSHTTRPKRDSEIEGKDYYFVSEVKFKRMAAGKKFVEWAVVHGNLYGTSRKEIEEKGKKRDVLLDIDVQGAQQIQARFKKGVFIFMLPPRYAVLKKRLQGRGEDRPEVVRQRLKMARKEIRCYSCFDFIVVNDRLEQAVRELESIILSARCRRDVRRAEIRSILKSFKSK
ncbi:MAG: guanylate kinase [Candidatus Aminicenantales bacterium]